MICHAVIPLKPLARAKSRLADLLTPEERQALVRSMFLRVLGTLVPLRGSLLAEVWVISRDPEVQNLATLHGARVIYDQAEDLNGALAQAHATLEDLGAPAMLVIPADVPLLSAADVAAMLDLLAQTDVVLVPDRHGQGTNALAMHLPCRLPFLFGSESAAQHQAAAAALGLRCQILTSPTLGLDVDDAASLGVYRGMEQSSTP
ncbi:2-phospho-L-lactate guanylyltransferase [Candidatus Oscillochloris fontis]|uniref:2-phospho-L-lactate guanylyltransferase n=1 Tax=Candidatus Oscillochloris fontis TaxID=2496868 RepID=UPI00101DFD91|nr:2-phospho-L-lactate guanylyltransferase [Candidatus Oscillochloris fontis]